MKSEPFRDNAWTPWKAKTYFPEQQLMELESLRTDARNIKADSFLDVFRTPTKQVIHYV